jgi:hypothetical protein
MAVLGECLYSYRVHINSISHRDPTRRMQDVAEVYRRARERRGLPPAPLPRRSKRITNSDRDNGLAAHFVYSVLDLREAGRWRESVGEALRCAKLHPMDPAYLKPLAYATLPMAIVRAVRARRRN